MTDVTLASAISQLRADLAEAQRQGASQRHRFNVKEVQIELALVAKTGSEVGGGIKAWFVEASAKGTTGRESGHKVVIKLEPQAGSGELLVSDDEKEPE